MNICQIVCSGKTDSPKNEEKKNQGTDKRIRSQPKTIPKSNRDIVRKKPRIVKIMIQDFENF